MTTKNNGCFITFEGGEGAGKSSLIESIGELLHQENIPFLITREPGGSLLGKQVRHWLLEQTAVPVASKAELLLFLADRAQHIDEVIIPALNQGVVVLCDRYIDSTVAYQAYGRGLDLAEVVTGCQLAIGDRVPDCTFLLDLPPKKGLARVKDHNKMENEALDFHNRVRDGFLTLAKEHSRIKVIDATQSKQKVFDDVVKELRSFSKLDWQ